MFLTRDTPTLLKVLLCLSFLCPITAFNYNDLRNLTSSCFKQGTCRANPINRLCFCDNNCIKYGDCCLDANVYDKNVMALPRNYECIEIPMTDSYYMKSSCLPLWNDEGMRELCHQAKPDSSTYHEDPFLDIPVTSHSSSVTYANSYCAICNNENPSALDIWNVNLSCSTHFVKENAQYINGTWGIFVEENGVQSFKMCDVFPSVPDTVTHKVRSCVNYKDTCSSTWEESDVEDLCHSYTTVVYGPPTNDSSSNDKNFLYTYPPPTVYRNYHCAKCNHVQDSEITCSIRDFRLIKDYSPKSFSILFDFGVQKSLCKDGKIWDAFSKTCRQVVCLYSNYEYREGRCVEKLGKIVTLVENSTDFSVWTNETNENMSNISQKCDKMFFNASDFTEGDNGTIIINSYRHVYVQEEYERESNGILVCIPRNYSRLMGWLSLFGLGLSCICIIVHLVVFCIVPELRNLSGKNLASLCVSLLVSYICFLTSAFRSMGDCQVLASFMYYFFLASFAWMNIMAFDVWRTLQLATSELRLTAGKQWKKFTFYSLYAWLLPAIALSVILILDNINQDTISAKYLPELGKRLCWFGQRKAILIYFAAPLAFIMTMNIVFFFMAVKMVAATARSSHHISSSQPQQVQLKLYLRLALLMGLSWILGIVAGYIQNEYVWYLFIILNAFQGVFILMAFTCTKKVYRALGPYSFKNVRDSFQKSLGRISTSSHALESKDSQLSNTCSTNVSNTSLKLK